MASSLLSRLTSPQDLLVLLGALAFLASGATLVVSSIRIGHEAIARRLEMVRPRVTVPLTAEEQLVLAQSLVRVPTSGLPEREQREIVRRLSAFRVPPKYAYAVFTTLRILFAATLAVLTAVFAARMATFAGARIAVLATVAAAAILGWFLPIMAVRSSARRRSKAVAAGLPEALELLVVCVEAGLSLEDGLERIIVELGRSQSELADELSLMSADLKILPSRDEALANLAERVDVPSIRSVVTTLAQTLRYGTPLAQALRVVASEMRNDALIHLEERANQLPALLTLPMMLFIMPTIFLITGGPAALRLIDVLLK
jgi:tight adherence protein C